MDHVFVKIPHIDNQPIPGIKKLSKNPRAVELRQNSVKARAPGCQRERESENEASQCGGREISSEFFAVTCVNNIGHISGT